MIPSIAPLTDADELFNHQIVNTHAAVGTADRSWTEKAWFTLIRKDATLQVGLGLGKYPNRNVMDGFAGVQRGTQQRTVRASRVLAPRFDDMSVGPIACEVIEPYKTLRITLAENDAQPLRFDLLFHMTMPAFFENRDIVVHGGRTASDLIRFHQPGTVSGWIEIDGERIEVNPDDWYGFRDRSWGVREHVGLDPTDLVPGNVGISSSDKTGSAFHFNWLVSKIDRPDGTSYDLAYYFRDYGGLGAPTFFTGHINESDGRQIPILHLHPEMDYRDQDRGAMRGRVTAILAGPGKQVVERVFDIEVINPEMGFRLLPGMYGAWKGQVHGSYKGEDFLDGECIDDVNAPAKLAETYRWQIRDRPVRIREGENEGFGDMESIILGDYPGVRIV
ncbi:hypothetical protein Q4F19_08855 [Sphingomonas sp. BIUV-7]|uniref:Uncharacterized protein n=1 Tax=Sphingomonas natans TaxID=3063330 RepID=A0ABT8Y829_9SPHN|nr:hypothetical protein [Sphingomonas sp. BIUV-7]MDO6414487.1 hypothetical protein [Sphingomonas sp. BIUV-7]